MERSRSEVRVGLLYGVAAYAQWGVMPIYFRALTGVGAFELLAHRIVWSAVLLAGLISYFGRWRQVRSCLVEPKTRWLLLGSTVLIAINWYVFIYGVSKGQIVQNSLGYFINPLLNVLIGVFVFRERPRLVQWLALLLACAGLVYLIVRGDGWPWIAFTLGVSFAGYGLLRKVAPVETLLGLTVETLVLTPAALAALAWWLVRDEGTFGKLGWQVDGLILFSGIATTGPLFCFGQAARKLPMTTLGFMQYLTPTMQFLTAVLVFGEKFGPVRQVSFSLIWSALALVIIDALVRSGVLGFRAKPGQGSRDVPRSEPSPADARAAGRP